MISSNVSLVVKVIKPRIELANIVVPISLPSSETRRSMPAALFTETGSVGDDATAIENPNATPC